MRWKIVAGVPSTLAISSTTGAVWLKSVTGQKLCVTRHHERQAHHFDFAGHLVPGVPQRRITLRLYGCPAGGVEDRLVRFSASRCLSW